ncbi:MAG TPA: hypothetical protein VIQ97_04460 [Prevotella sp.]
MNRVFHQRFAFSAKCAIALFSLLAAYFLWHRNALPGVLTLAVVVVMIERVVHSTYTFMHTEQGEVLVIDHGRFARKVQIRLTDVVRCRKMKAMFGLYTYLLMEFGAHHVASIRPYDEAGFVEELRKRQERDLQR